MINSVTYSAFEFAKLPFQWLSGWTDKHFDKSTLLVLSYFGKRRTFSVIVDFWRHRNNFESDKIFSKNHGRPELACPKIIVRAPKCIMGPITLKCIEWPQRTPPKSSSRYFGPIFRANWVVLFGKIYQNGIKHHNCTNSQLPDVILGLNILSLSVDRHILNRTGYIIMD